MNHIRCTLLKALITLVEIFMVSDAFATADPPLKSALIGDSSQIKKNNFCITADMAYYAATTPANITYDTLTCRYANIVTLMINEQRDSLITSNFTVTVPLHISYTSAFKDPETGQFIPLELDTSLTINYSKDSGTFVARKFILDSGYRKVTVTIRESLVSNVSWDVSRVLMIENEMRVTRDYKFNCSAVIELKPADFPQINNKPQKDELMLSWYDLSAGQNGYDVEWAWIDESAVEGYKENTLYSEHLIFMNNASRVTVGTDKTSYNIPLIYDGNGRIFYRVRPIQDKDDGSRLEGSWTHNVNTSNSLSNFFSFSGHENNLNWQVTTSYAEEGKRKTVIQYFDGSLRSRQTVTKDNTTGTTVVAETMYDYQGRPAIQVLPAPTLNTMISFSKNFNIGMNGSYEKDAYDGLLSTDIICLKPAGKMIASTTGASASQYYSPSNPLKTDGMNQFIPDAKEYPFTETRYTPDATGRIAAQSGVGIDHILGSGHETRYYYGQADQEDLDPLFGSDVGYASHYFKNMVRDANGQYSVSYVDMHGRTVATALAGKNPGNLQALSSMPTNPDSVTKKLLDKETNIVKGRSIESQKELLVPVDGGYHFKYKLEPETLKLLDKNNADICYSCMYDLEIEISNDCGNCNLPNNKPIYIRRNNFRLDDLDSICPNLRPDTAHQPASLLVDTTVILKEGSYTVRKTLTLSRQAQDEYRDGLYTRRNTVKTFESIYNEVLTLMAGVTNCPLNCVACTTRTGDLPTFRQRYLTEAAITSPTLQQEQEITDTWIKAMEACAALCNEGTNRLQGIRGAMLQDMMPDLGQYATSDSTTKKYNIFNAFQQPAAPWLRPRNIQTDALDCYTNTNGQCVNVAQTVNSEVIGFISVFQESWANNLLYYHPEYYRLKLAEDPAYLKNSYAFDDDIQKITTWSAAMAYLGSANNYDILKKDYYFTTLANPEEGSMRTKITNFVGGYGMWQIAYGAVACKNKTTPAEIGTCITNAPNDAATINASSLCNTDKDMIWNIFRQMYLFEKEKRVYIWSTNKIQSLYNVILPTTVQLAQLHYTPRFVDPATLSAYPGGSIATGLANPPNTTQIQNSINTEYIDNCTALAENWRTKLEVFKQCGTGINDAMLDGLTLQLKAICVAGSDITHPFGSSSISPTATNYPVTAPKTFEQAIAAFMSSRTIPYSATCNPYILSDIDPEPYTAQQSFSNPDIISKPDSCQCAQIANVKAKYIQSGFSGNFSAYLAQQQGTVISQGALDTLQNLCSGTYTCAILPSPISLPPALQCGASSQTCIGCETFNMYRDSFRVRFGASWPVANHPDTAYLPLDSAFASYVNYKTGFNKSIDEYLSFADTCGQVSTTDTCRRLDSIAHAFVTTYDRTRRMYNANTGCDTAHWVSNYGEGTLQVVPLSQIMINGEFVPKFKDSASRGSSLDYYDNVCFDSSTIEIRIKSPRTGYGFNPYSSHIYAFEFYMYYGNTKKAVLSFDVDNATTDLYYTRDPSGTQFLQLPYNFDDYKVLKVVVGQSQYHIYIDGVHIADFPHQLYERLTGFVLQPYSTSLRADYVKIYDKNNQILMQEDFDHDCGSMAFITREPCRPADCQTAFAEYYNQLSGTNLTYSQIQNISQQQCGKALNVCPSAPSDTCAAIKYLVSDYRKQMERTDTLYPVQIRTLTGTPTPEEGPKGVFDINGNLIGNTIETGSVLAIKQSFVQIWNSSTVNQQIGTLSVDNFGRLFLKLNAGKPYPCKGIIGLRYYQFDTESDHINAVRTGVGTYVDFGDGSRINATQTYSGTTTQVYFKATTTELANYNGGVFFQSVLGTWYVLHQYPSASLRTITVYHSDTLGHVGLDCYNCGVTNPPGADYNLTSAKNLRGYIPRQTIQWYWAGTRDLTFNRTSQIKNLAEATRIRLIGHGSSNAYATASVDQHQDNFFAYNRWDTFPASTNLRYLQLDYRGEWDNATVPVSNYLPNWTINYSNIEFIAVRNFKGHTGGKMVSWAFPHISKIVLYFHDYNANEIDTLLMQVAAATDRCGGEIELYNALTDRTSASDAAIASLQARGWTIRFSYYNNGGTYSPTSNCTETYNSPTPFTYPNTNIPYISPFTEWLAQRGSYNITPQYAEELVSRCGTTSLCGEQLPVAGPRLCGLNEPKFPKLNIPVDTCGADVKDMVFNKAKEYYEFYKDSLRNVFDTAYYNKCMKAADIESFNVTYKAYEYHYTLYYYDQAGNLVQTVPPEGVHPRRDITYLQNVAAARSNESALPERPTHTLVTQYRYNTLNQVVEQKTPDAHISDFWYDRLGRLVVSQNAKQANEGSGKYSYTLYDYIGRINEVGQKPAPPSPYGPMSQGISRDATKLSDWLNAGSNKEEITQTIYDLPYLAFVGVAKSIGQRNLRNRVSYVRLLDAEADLNIPAGHKAATYYTYDIHGNVDTLLQDINQSVMQSATGGNRFKKIVYAYDLISGKVNYVAYQRGWKDQFFHKYDYDAENRITNVFTSGDEVYWEQDVAYNYYKHGPLARTILGQLQVQGLDYAYTIQGWLKGVNSTNLQTSDDMGRDGANANKPAKDVMGFSLNYYSNTTTPVSNDYQPINASAGVHPFAAMPALTGGGSLYNGNISAMMVSLPKIGVPILYNYAYDQLNRIVAMDAYTGLNTASNVWTPVNTTNYKERISYDANGNIETYLRNGSTTSGRPLEMDNMTYQYEKDASGNKSSNRLRYVHDAVADANYSEDIDNETALSLSQVLTDHQLSQPGDNYQYDPIGNLIHDEKNKLGTVTWTVYGKIKSISKTNGVTINYTYDASGNRLTKTVTKESKTKTTVYVRDAQGNVMSVYYKEDTKSLKQSEVNLYGSSRVGLWLPDRDVEVLAEADNSTATFKRGAKRYELSNYLGNVMVTVSDKKSAVDDDHNNVADYYTADVVTTNDYYPFGMQMPARRYDDGALQDPAFDGGLPQSLIMGTGSGYSSGTTLLTSAEDNFTVELWVKPTAEHEIDPESQYTTGGTYGQKFVIDPVHSSTNTSIAGMGISVGTNGVSVYEHADYYMPALLVWQSPAPLTAWTHIAVVYENKTPKLYINGVLVRSGITSPKSHVYPGNLVASGAYGTMEGQVDEVRVWSYVRTQQQIEESMNATVAAPQAGLAAYWPIRQSDGTTLQDISGNNHPVILNSSYSTTNWSSDAAALRSYKASSYPYGFNNKMKDSDIGEDDYDYGARIYDARLGRLLSVDPLTAELVGQSPYVYAANNPILFVDKDGEAPSLPPLFNPAEFTRSLGLQHSWLLYGLTRAQNSSLSHLQKAAWYSNNLIVRAADSRLHNVPTNFRTLYGIAGEVEMSKRELERIAPDQFLGNPIGSFFDTEKLVKSIQAAHQATAFNLEPDKLTDYTITFDPSKYTGKDKLSYTRTFDDVRKPLFGIGSNYIDPQTLGMTVQTKTDFIFEVKIVSPENEDIFKIIERGVDQLLANPRVIAGGIPVLVMDRGAANTAVKADINRFSAAINKLVKLNGGLQTEVGLNVKSTNAINAAIKTAREKTTAPPSQYYNGTGATNLTDDKENK